MGRELKRVPLDFNWPIGKIWPGFMFNLCSDMEYILKKEKYKGERCDCCKLFGKLAKLPKSKYCECPESKIEPPIGDGYQLWETTSGGSPISPVFQTLEELCDWAAENASTFADCKATAVEWAEMLMPDVPLGVYCKKGNIFFI